MKVVVVLSALDFFKANAFELGDKEKALYFVIAWRKTKYIRENNAKYILQHDQDQTHAFLTTNRLQSCQICATTLLSELFG